MGSEGLELSILLTTDKVIEQLNAEYRGKHRPTDVLSFSLREGRGAKLAGNCLGDVVISLQTTKRQAKAYAVTYEEEFIRLLVHGVLHLHGYDHVGVSKSKAQQMRRKEKKLFDELVTDLL